MGFFKKLFFGEDDEKKSEIEKQIRADPKAYTQAQRENIPTCNGCGGDIEGKPRIRKHQGKIMYFHKRCWKSMLQGKLPKPIKNNG